MTQVTYCRWRREFGRPHLVQVKRMQGLWQEYARPRKAVSDSTVDKMIVPGAAII